MIGAHARRAGPIIRMALSLVLGAVPLAAGHARAQQPAGIIAAERLRVLAPDDPFLVGIRAAAFHGETLAVLTSPEPSVFVFGPEGVKAWGNKGRGPAEFMNPGDVAWMGDRLLVWDFDLLKIATFEPDGTLRSTRRFGGLPVGHMALSAEDTLVSVFIWGGGPRTIVRLSGDQRDTLATLAPPADRIRLEAQGSPSLTLAPPYSPTATWAALPTGGIVVWDGRSKRLDQIDLQGRVVGRLPLPTDRYAVSAEDRAAWLSEVIPSGDVGGRGDLFGALRSAAHGEVEFPAEFPQVLEILGDPHGGVWIRRTPSARGEIWTYVDHGGARLSLRFPPEAEVLTVGAASIAVKAVDEFDVESVEIYRNPLSSPAGPTDASVSDAPIKPVGIR